MCVAAGHTVLRRDTRAQFERSNVDLKIAKHNDLKQVCLVATEDRLCLTTRSISDRAPEGIALRAEVVVESPRAARERDRVVGTRIDHPSQDGC